MKNIFGKKKYKKRILIVDDEAVVRRTCELSLTRVGYEVRTVSNGIEALQDLVKYDSDIVIIDLKMPLMGGMELLENIRRDFPHLQVIIMTGYATIENAVQAMKYNAFDFILKPFNAEQIRMVVDKCAENLDMSQEIKDLKVANEKLRELQEMKDRFIAITSHELRTPVSHIKGYLTILTDETYSDSISAEEKQEFINIINSAVEDLEHIVLNMFNINQLENNSLKLLLEQVSLNNIVDQIIKECQLITKERNLTVKFNRSEDLPYIIGDRLKLKQMINELFQNAIKFTRDGGEIVFSTKADEEYCFVSVADNGIGLNESEKSKIFEKFYEVQNPDHHSTSKINFMGGGLGIGLNIAKAISEAHKGRMKVLSELGEGAEFTVILPIENRIIEEGNIDEYVE